MVDLSTRYTFVQQQIIEAAKRVDKDANNITLIAVTKRFPVETILSAYEVGIRHFGENRPEELAKKRGLVETKLGKDAGIVWHCIGNIQSRKTALVAEYADVFHALDRLKLAHRLSVQLKGMKRILPILLQVNVSGELSKAGFTCYEWETNQKQQENFLREVEEIASISNLQIQGLMTIAPWGVSESDISAVFKRTQALAQWLKEVKPQVNWSTLSMGMTDDFPLAIVVGATHIRVGRGLFGNRK